MTKLDPAAPVASPRQEPPRRASRDPIYVTLFVIGAIVAGIGFRFVTKSDLWLDEALAVNVARLPIREIPHWLRHDGAPPFYYYLLHAWMAVFGTSDLAVRALSGVFGVGSLYLAWLCGKRTGGRATAWVAVLVLATNTYAIIYATSVRQYGMEIFLVFLGILLVRRAFELPSWLRIAPIALLVAVLLYTHYWNFYLVASATLFLIGTVWLNPEYRPAAVRMLIAVGIGFIAFVPWLPTFFYQAKHTGTPWGKALLPPTPIGLTFQDFSGGQSQEGWILFLTFTVLAFLGAFGMARDTRHIDIDLHGQRSIRWEAAVGAAALVIGASLAWASRSAFQPRYAAIMFPFFVLVVAHGICTFDSRWVRGTLVVMVVGLGCIGGVRNITTNRTAAGRRVVRILRADAKPGDVVLYCPDQLGPAVHRLAPKGLDEVTYPRLLPPALVDWVDYKKVLAAHKPADVAQAVLDRAGSNTIWYVSAPGYQTHPHACDTLAASLAKARPMKLRMESDIDSFEKPGLKEFPAS